METLIDTLDCIQIGLLIALGIVVALAVFCKVVIWHYRYKFNKLNKKQ